MGIDGERCSSELFRNDANDHTAYISRRVHPPRGRVREFVKHLVVHDIAKAELWHNLAWSQPIGLALWAPAS